MKKILITLMLVIISCITYASNAKFAQPSSDETEKVLVDFRTVKVSGPTDIERNLTNYNIEAYYYPQTGVIEVNILGIGTTAIYIYDSEYNLLDTSIQNTDIPMTVYFFSNSPGTNSIIVISDTYYAEGTFTVM